MAETPAPDRGSKSSSRFLTIANVLTSQLNTALVTAGAFVITPAVLNGLGDSAYGGWLLMNAFIGYMRLLDQGTTAGTLKFGSGALARGDQEDLSRIFNTTSAVFAVVGLVAALVTGIFALVLPRAFASILSGQAFTIATLGLATAIDLFFRTYGAALRTRSLFLVYDSIEILTYTIFKLGLVLYFAPHLSYRTLAIITFAETAMRNLLVIGSSLFFCPYVRHLRPQRADRGMFRRIALMGAAVAVIQIADVVRFQLDSGVIGYFIPDSATLIAIFGVGTRVPSIAYLAIGVIGAVMVPRFSGLSETGEHDEVFALLRKASLSTGIVSSYIMVNAAVLGPHFLTLWLKKPWTHESGQILLMMLPAYYVTIFGGPTASLLLARDKLRRLAAITVVEAACNFILSVALVKPLGIYGVALGTIIPMVVVRGVVLPIIVERDLGIAPLAWWSMHLRGLGIGVAYLLIIGGFAWLPLVSYARFVLYGTATTAIYVLLLALALPEARNWLRAKLLRRAAPGTP